MQRKYLAMAEELIQKLTEILYQDGLEKGESEAKKVISEAEKERDRIIDEARQRAKVIIDEAENKSRLLKEQIETEIRVVSREMIHDLHARVTDLISYELVENKIESKFNEIDFVGILLIDIIKKWDPQFGGEASLEIILPENLKEEFNQWIEKHVLDILAKKPKLTFSHHLKGGFQIKPEGASYKIDFSREGFIELFNYYLKPATRKILFKD